MCAQPRLDALDARFLRLRGEAVGVLVVEQAASLCLGVGHARCLEMFGRWRRASGQHPLVAQVLDRRMALEQRVAGRREDASRLTARLGFIRTWRIRTPEGEEAELPADPISGEVRGADFLELPPGEPVLIWADVAVRSEAPVALRVSAADLEEVCVGGECTALEPHTSFFWDQHVVFCRLAPGTTRVELRFLPQAAPVRVAARLTRPDGGELPLSGKGGRSSSTGRKSKSVEGVTVRQSLDSLPESTEKLLLACFLERASGAGYGGDGAESLVAEAELDTLPEWLEAIECLEGSPVLHEVLSRGDAVWGDRPEMVLSHAAYLLRAGRVLDGLGKLRSLCPDGGRACLTPELEAQAALVAREPLSASGLSLHVEEMLRAALARAGKVPALVSALSEVLSEQERYQEASDLAGSYLEEWPGDYEMAATQLFLLEKLGRASEEVKLAERLNWLFPTMPFLRHVLASGLETAREQARAAELYGSLEAWAPHHPYLLERAAEFHYRAGNRERALALWKRVLRLHPQDRNLRGLLARLQSEGDVLRPRFSDDEIRRVAASVPATGVQRLVGVMDRTHIMAHPNRAWQLERWVAVKALAPVEEGRLRLGVAYDSYLEEATVLRAAVLRADGSKPVAVPYGDIGVSEEEFNLYYDMRQVTFTFPALAAGDVAVAAWGVDSSPSPLRTPFSGVVWLQADYPKHGVEVEISMPPGTDLFHRAGPDSVGLTVEQDVTSGEEGVVHWLRFGPIPAQADEPLGPGRFRSTAHLEYSTLATWEDFARWYAPVVSPAVGGDASMKRLVARLAGETGGDRTALTEAICRYVADEVRYVGLEFGVHGLKPYPPAEVFRRGFGDCKDKSLLLVTLLAEAGIPAHVVAASTVALGAEVLDPGAPTSYDHAIAYLDELDVFFDPTSRFVGLGLVPWQVEGGGGVILDSRVPRKVVFREGPAQDNRSVLDLSVSAGSPMLFAGEIRFTGQFVWRVQSIAENRGAWEGELESYLADYLPGADITGIEEELTCGPVPELRIAVSGSWVAPGSVLRLTPDLEALTRATSLPERKQVLVFGYRYVQEVRLDLHPGTVRMPVGIFQAADEEDAAFTLQVEALPDGGARLELRLEQRSRSVPVERYPAFRRLVQQLRAALAGVEGVVDEK